MAAGAGLRVTLAPSPLPLFPPDAGSGLGPLIWPFVSIFDRVFRYSSIALPGRWTDTAYLVVCSSVHRKYPDQLGVGVSQLPGPGW